MKIPIAALFLAAALLAPSSPFATPPIDNEIPGYQAAYGGRSDRIPAGAERREAEDGRASTKRLDAGVLMMVSGALMVPIGFGVRFSNSVPKCEEDVMIGGNLICNENGPSEVGQAVGGGMMLGGFALFIAGLVTLFNRD